MIEKWVPVPGWEDLYEVSDQGQVRSLPRETRTGSWPGTIRKLNSLRSGHMQVALWKQSHRTTVGVHVLVMQSFMGPRPEGQEVRHLDGDPTNNVLSNLAYGTRSDQRRDDIRNGVHVTARQTHCRQGHEFDDENTYVEPSTGKRKCRACMSNRRKNRKARAA